MWGETLSGVDGSCLAIDLSGRCYMPSLCSDLSSVRQAVHPFLQLFVVQTLILLI